MTLDACNQTRPCVDSAWAWTGAERCNGEYVEREYKSNCDNIDWRIERAVTWVDTGNYRCGATTTEVEQRNDCGSTRWISGVPFVWSDTGLTRCTATKVQKQQENQCKQVRWVDAEDVQWVDTGETRCATTTVQKKQLNQCGAARWVDAESLAWVETGQKKCENHLIVVEEVNNCGTKRWTTTTEVCGYSPSVPFVIEVFDGCCGGNQVGYMYHPDEDKDPAATVAVTDCDGVVWGYIYPTATTGRTLPVGACDEQPIGYAVNQSTTAPSFAQCGGDVIVNVSLTPIEVIVPEPPRSVLSVGWSGDNLLLTYSDGSNQTIATPVC